jgi:hypothetical protein
LKETKTNIKSQLKFAGVNENIDQSSAEKQLKRAEILLIAGNNSKAQEENNEIILKLRGILGISAR